MMASSGQQAGMGRPLEGRVALVTGSSRGIGAAIATRLAADGAHVVIHGSASPDRATALADAIRRDGGVADIVLGDLCRPEMSAEVVRRAFEIGDALDILVNNAALSGYALLPDLTAESIATEINLNLVAVITGTAEYARLTRSPHGRVINISSVSGRHAAYGRTVYSATKGAMEAFTRSASLELGRRGITVNAVAPGTTATELLEENERRDDKDWRGLFSRWTALGRVGQPEEIADIVAFVASDQARWLTAAVIPADGGLVTTGTNVATFTS